MKLEDLQTRGYSAMNISSAEVATRVRDSKAHAVDVEHTHAGVFKACHEWLVIGEAYYAVVVS